MEYICLLYTSYTGSFALKVAATVYGNCEGTETEPPTYTSAEGLETFLKGDGKMCIRDRACTVCMHYRGYGY